MAFCFSLAQATFFSRNRKPDSFTNRVSDNAAVVFTKVKLVVTRPIKGALVGGGLRLNQPSVESSGSSFDSHVDDRNPAFSARGHELDLQEPDQEDSVSSHESQEEEDEEYPRLIEVGAVVASNSQVFVAVNNCLLYRKYVLHCHQQLLLLATSYQAGRSKE